MSDTDPGYFQKAIAGARSAVAAEVPEDPEYGRPKRATALAIAWLEEVNAEYDMIYDRASPAFKAEIDLAKKLCSEKHDRVEGDNVGRVVTMFGPVPAPYAVVPGADFTRPERHVVCVQNCMGGARPLWVHYLNAAREFLNMTPADRAEALLIAAEREKAIEEEKASG